MNDVMEGATETAAREEEVRKVLSRAYSLDAKQNADYQAIGVIAVECALKLFNILRSARTRTGVQKGYMDLVVGLNNNPFWVKHGAALLPILHIAIQAQTEYALLMLEKKEAPTATHNNALLAESQLVGLEIFVLIAYCLAGQEFMVLKALEIKKALAPYFME